MANTSRIKWNKNGSAALYLLDLLKNQEVDPNNIKRDYILRLKDQHPVFKPYSVDRFVANVRKLFREYNLEKTLQGRRKISPRKLVDDSISFLHNCIMGWLLFSPYSAAEKKRKVVESTDKDEEEEEYDEDYVYQSESDLEDSVVAEKSDEYSEKEAEEKEDEKEDEKEEEVEGIVHNLAIMTSKIKIDSSKQSSNIFCKGDIPVIVTTYDDKEGNNIAVVDVVCFAGTLDDQYRVEVSADRLTAELKYAVPPTFLHPSWLTMMDTRINRHSARFQAYNRVIEALRKTLKNEQPFATLKIPMPFKIESAPRFTNITAFEEIDDLKLQILTVEFKALETVARINTIRKATPKKEKGGKGDDGDDDDSMPSRVPSSMEFFL